MNGKVLEGARTSSFRVLGSGRTGANLASHTNAVLHLQIGNRGVLHRVGNHLNEAGGVSHVDEGDAPMVASTLDPAGDDDFAPDIRLGDRPRAMRPDHVLPLSQSETSSSGTSR